MIALDGLRRQLLFHVLPEELFKQHRERFGRRRRDTGAGFRQFVFLLFLGSANSLGIFGFAFGRESELPDRQRAARGPGG